MKPEFERVRNLLKESVTLLCKNSLKYEAELCVEGLLGVTLDHKEIFLININEIVKSNWPKENARSATASSSKEPVPSESRNRDGRSEQRESWGSRRGDSRSSDGDASSTSSESYSRKHRRVVESDSMVDLTEDDSDTQTHSNLRSLGPTRSPMQHAHTRQIVPVAMSTSNQMQAFGRVRQHDAINLTEPPAKRQFFSTEGGGPSKPGDTATDLDSLIIIKEVDGDEEGSISGFGEVVAQFSQGFGASPSFGQPAAVVGSSSGQKPDSSLYGSPGMPRQYDHLLGRKRITNDCSRGLASKALRDAITNNLVEPHVFKKCRVSSHRVLWRPPDDQTIDAKWQAIVAQRNVSDDTVAKIPGVSYFISSISGVSTHMQGKDKKIPETLGRVYPAISYWVVSDDLGFDTYQVAHDLGQLHSDALIKPILQTYAEDSLNGLCSALFLTLKDHKNSLILHKIQESVSYCKAHMTETVKLEVIPNNLEAASVRLVILQPDKYSDMLLNCINTLSMNSLDMEILTISSGS